LVSGVLPLLIASLVLCATATVLRMRGQEENARAQAAVNTLRVAASVSERMDDAAARRAMQAALGPDNRIHLLELRRPDGTPIVVGLATNRAPVRTHRVTATIAAGELTAIFDWQSPYRQRSMTAWFGGAMGLGLVLLAALSNWCQQLQVIRPLEAVAARLERLGQPLDGTETSTPRSGIAEIDRIGDRVASLYDRDSPLAGNIRHSRFMASVGHHFRQPLQALQLFIAGLQPGAGSRERAALAQMRGSVGTMTRLLDGLVELSRFDAGVVKAQSVAFLASDIFVREYAGLGQLATRRNVELIWHGGGTLIHSDPVLLGALLHRLACNAIDHAPNGRVLIAARRHGDIVRLEVRDNGIGIDATQHDRIFDEFVQLGPADERPGYGLGLAIAHRIAAVLGSRIEVRSEPGRGSNFWIDLRGAVARQRPGRSVHAMFRKAG
jgi:signal transduction histidine kinase